MSLTSSLLSRVLGGGSCSREELIALSREPLEELCQAANAIREHFCGNVFDLCTIINGRSGKCSENCKYCAQSAHYSTAVEEYPLLSDEALLAGARYNDARGILRYSIVTSGKTGSAPVTGTSPNIAASPSAPPTALFPRNTASN